jgi:hypothetical protein
MESVEFSDVGLFRAQNIHRIMQPLDGTVTMNLHSRALESAQQHSHMAQVYMSGQFGAP